MAGEGLPLPLFGYPLYPQSDPGALAQVATGGLYPRARYNGPALNREPQ
jgi:hypothetical protein